jgi:hypothetical protein
MAFYQPLRQIDGTDDLPTRSLATEDSPIVDKVALGNDQNVLVENVGGEPALTDANGTLPKGKISTKAFAIAVAITLG